MEMLRRSNNLAMSKNVVKVDLIEKHKEYLLTELNDYVHKNILNLTEEETRNYFTSLDDFKISYEGSYIVYDKKRDCFKGEYNINGKFYKKELYEYQVSNAVITCSCIDYSFEKEGI